MTIHISTSPNVTTFKTGKYVFFLGGKDAEMHAIFERLKNSEYSIFDKNLQWGAKIMDYESEILNTLANNKTPILIELSEEGISDEIKSNLTNSKIRTIDHHGDKTKNESSIMQVLSLLGLIPNRIEFIISANDEGYIGRMEDIGATPEEIEFVLKLDRSFHGITEDMELEGKRAIANMEFYGNLDDLIIIRMKHNKTKIITDTIHGKQKRENVLILSENGESNYFGDGELCKKLKELFNGWSGGIHLGEKGKNAYWGGYCDQVELEEYIKNNLSYNIL